jgi:hypothetical protein
MKWRLVKSRAMRTTTDAVAMLKEHQKNLASELARIDAALTALK